MLQQRATSSREHWQHRLNLMSLKRLQQKNKIEKEKRKKNSVGWVRKRVLSTRHLGREMSMMKINCTNFSKNWEKTWKIRQIISKYVQGKSEKLQKTQKNMKNERKLNPQLPERFIAPKFYLMYPFFNWDGPVFSNFTNTLP